MFNVNQFRYVSTLLFVRFVVVTVKSFYDSCLLDLVDACDSTLSQATDEIVNHVAYDQWELR